MISKPHEEEERRSPQKKEHKSGCGRKRLFCHFVFHDTPEGSCEDGNRESPSEFPYPGVVFSPDSLASVPEEKKDPGNEEIRCKAREKERLPALAFFREEVFDAT